MSTISGIGSKGEKNKSKYKGIDINTLYKGKSVEPPKSAVPRQHGLQSLGKVSSLRRMPPPANLPSLKSENSGNDPSVNLVPSGGSGWGSKEEKKECAGGGSQPQLSQLQQATPSPAPTQQTQQTQAATKTSTPSGGQNSTVRSWSTITGGVQQGGLVSHQSPLFQEEFPTLAQEEKNKELTQTTKKEEDTKDTQYGPGPSLRPQNVASWREGGGRAVPQPKPEDTPVSSANSNQTETPQNGPQMSGGSGGGPENAGEGPPPPVGPPRPGSGHGLPPSAMPMGPHMGMPPPHHPSYRGMMPPYMFPRQPHGSYPPNYPGFARTPFPDPRFRGPPPSMQQRLRGDGDDVQKRPAIVSEKQLNDFDELLKIDHSETGWAGPQGEIDYSEKLVFSDDEDDSKSPRDKSRIGERRREAMNALKEKRDLEDHSISDGSKDEERKDDKDDDPGLVMVREAWPHGPPRYRGAPRPPHPGMDGRGWPPHMHPYEFMGPRGAHPYGFRMPPPHQMRPYGPPPPPVSSPGAMPPRKAGEDDDEMWRMKRRANEGEINTAIGRARQRREEEERRKDCELKAAAAEKLRQLDERSKKKDDGKDSDVERRSSRTASESSDKDSVDSRHKDRQSSYNPNQGEHISGSKGYTRQVAPRFQKQEALMGVPTGQQRQQPPSPVTGGPPPPPLPPAAAGPMPQGFRPRQGHPPPPWGPYDMRTWGPMPFMDPRYGPRPPMDMQGMSMYGPPMARRRHDSQEGSGNEGQDAENRHPEQFERPSPHAQWMERGYPPHQGHFEDMRRYPYMDQRAYQERFEFERREYERHEDEGLSGQSESDKSQKDIEIRPPPLMRNDSLEERVKSFSDKDERKSERSNSKNSSDWEQKSYKDSKDGSFDQFDEESLDKSGKENIPEETLEEPYPTRGYRRDGRQGPTPTFRAYSSEERSRRETSGKQEGVASNGPPPLLEVGKQSGPSKSSLTSLKRSASNMSSSSATSSEKERERKSDSPKESLIFERSSLPKKESSSKQQDLVKESKPQDKSVPEPVRPNAWEIKEQDRAKVNKEKEKPKVVPFPKDEDIEKEYDFDRVDSPLNNRPPVKKKREDEQDKDRRDYYDDHERRDRDPDRFDRGGERPRVNNSRGREFVRGRGGSRSRGRSSARGGFGPRPRNKDYFPPANYDRSQGNGRGGQRKIERQPLLKPDASKSDDSDDDYSKPKHGFRGDKSEDFNKEYKDYPKSHERREPLLSNQMDKDRYEVSKEGNNSWTRDKDKNPLVAAPPPLNNPWNKENKPLLPLPTSRPDYGLGDSAGKEDLNSDRNSWNHRQVGFSNDSADKSDNFEGESIDKSKRQDYRRDFRDGRRRQDRDGDRRDKDDGQDGNDREGGRERSDRYNKDRDHDRRNRDRDNQDAQGNVFVPRGEPTRRGRGGPRGGRGGSRYVSAPSGRGGSSNGGNSQRMDSFSNQNGSGANGRQTGSGRDSRLGNNEGSNFRRDGRRPDNRNQQPPRFSRTNTSSESRGRGSDRGGRGRSSRGRGTSAPTNLPSGSKKPVLTKQASNDGEEWETASESSEPKNDPRESRDKKESSIKKSSNQRQFNDRPSSSRRLNNQDSRSSVERRNSNKDKQNPKNGVAPPTNKSAANGNGSNSTKSAVGSAAANHKENVVFRVDGVVPSDPNAINNAINSLQNKKPNKKASEITETSKPTKTEKEKKDALANIDINNYASVVVVDDQPEVTTDDPNFIFESNEGFREVTSKKTFKTKQKLIEAEQKKSEKECQKKKDHSNKVVARPKGLSPKTGRVGTKGTKLPPRLAKQREIREKEKELSKNVMPKIELWDNELANNIPSLEASLGTIAATSSSSTCDVGIDDVGDLAPPSTTIVINAKTSVSSMTATPAPTPTTNAWSKPFRFPAAVGQHSQPASSLSSTQQPAHAVVVVAASANPKLEKGDQHDSGIDVSDQPNSASSSTRSSPSADNKITIPASSGQGLKRVEDHKMDLSHSVEAPKPQRPAKVGKSEKITQKEVDHKDINEVIINKEVTDTKPEPIQMPPSFKDSIFSKDEGSSLQLDFNYDESLAEQTAIPDKVETASVHREENHLSTSGPIVSPTSPATEDLSSKIASVKNFWDPLPPAFEQGNIPPSSSVSSGESSLQANNNSNASPGAASGKSYHHSSFGRDVGGVVNVSVGVMNGDNSSPVDLEDDQMPVQVKATHSPSLQRLQLSPHPAEKAAMMSDVEVVHDEHEDHGNKVVSMMEPTNVCKVRPQQLQVGAGSESSNASVLSSAIAGPLPTVASPPIVLTNQPAFQIPIGSQFVPQEQRYTQPSFGFSLTQAQGHGALRGQHQASIAPSQQAFSQPSFIVPSTPTQPAEMFPSSHLSFQQQRTPGFAQPAAAAAAPPPAPQHSTIMVSSASSTLMSSNLKAQGPSHGAAPQGMSSAFNTDTLGKSLGHNQLYSGGLGGSSLPGAPSQQLFYYDPHPQALGQLFQPAHSQLIGASQPTQNLNNSQIIGSQLLQTRTPVQASSSFFQPAQAVSYFQTQQPSTTVQVGGPIQQVTNGHQFPVQAAFGSQTHGLGLTLQPTGPAGMESGPPQAAANMGLHHPTQSIGHGLQGTSKSSHFAATPAQQQQQQLHLGTVGHHPQQLQHVLGPSRTSQIKSPSQSSHQTNLFNSSQSSGSHNFNQGGHGPSMKPQSMASLPSGSLGLSAGMNSGTKCGSSSSNVAHPHHVSDGTGMAVSNRMVIGGTGGCSAAISASSHGFSAASSSSMSSSSTRSGPSQSRFPNPNAPNFPPSNKYSTSGNKPNTPPASQSIPPVSSFPSQAPQVSGNPVMRPQMMMGMRGNGPMQGPNNPRPQFPNPIQRPGSPSTPGPRPPSNMMGQGGGPNPTSAKLQNLAQGGGNSRPNQGGPLNLGNMNLGNSTIISSMILNAASVISQTVGSQLALHQGGGGGGPGNPNMPFPNKGGPAAMPAFGPGHRSGGPPHQHMNKAGGVGHPPPPQALPPPGKQAPGSYPGLASSLKAQQAQQRQALLTHAANFLNNSMAKGAPQAQLSKVEEKKAAPPPLAMVSNPGLVGTSVKIDFSASSNSRAPAVSTTTTAAATATPQSAESKK